MKKQIFRKSALVLACILILSLAFYIYFSMKGNPIAYFRAKQAMQAYIVDNYDGVLTLGEITYSAKAACFTGEVTEIRMSQNRGALFYYPGTNYLSDDYAFRIRLKMEDELTVLLSHLTRIQTGLDETKICFYPHLDLPPFIYTMEDSYDETLPAEIDIELKQEYTSTELFAEEVLRILPVISDSGITVKSLQFKSFLPDDGNKYYQVMLRAPTANFDEVLKSIDILEAKK